MRSDAGFSRTPFRLDRVGSLKARQCCVFSPPVKPQNMRIIAAGGPPCTSPSTPGGGAGAVHRGQPAQPGRLSGIGAPWPETCRRRRSRLPSPGRYRSASGWDHRQPVLAVPRGAISMPPWHRAGRRSSLTCGANIAPLAPHEVGPVPGWMMTLVPGRHMPIRSLACRERRCLVG